ncbi:MAG: hemerythrin family protein [Azoarcus sp.]|jgi:hemerythrin|nr:hemerythrin family protein [Azoarcus sp.]
MYRPLFIKWQDKNNTGIEIIDEQHRGIVSIINSFYFLIEKSVNDKALCISISETIKKYSHIHFLSEERLLKAAKYPDIEKHIAIHRSLTKETERIEHAAINDNDPMLLLQFMKKWWLEHINDQDMLYAPCLREYEKNADD